MVTSFQNMMISPLDDRSRCIPATGDKEHTGGREPVRRQDHTFCLGKSFVIFDIMIQDETLIFMLDPENKKSMSYGFFRMKLFCH